MHLNNLKRNPQVSFVTLLVIISLAVLAGAAISMGGVNIAIASIIAIVGMIILACLDKSSIFMFVIVIVSAISLNFWLQLRFEVFGFPISVPDLIVIAYGVYGLFRWLKVGIPHSLGIIGKLVIIWFLYNSVIGVILGSLNGNPLYAILQEYRVILYTTVSYLTTLVVFRPKRHIPVVLWGMLAAGVLVSVWQIGISISGRDLPVEDVIYVGTDFISRTLRDTTLPSYFAGPSFMVLVAAQFETSRLFSRGRFLLWGLVPLLVVGPLLSMTRTVWVAIAVTTLLVLVYATYYTLQKKRLHTLIGFLIVIGLLIVLGGHLVQVFLPSVYDSVGFSLQYTITGIDRTRTARLDIPLQVVADLTENGLELFTGVGFGNMWSGAIRERSYTDLHVVYLFYLVVGGPIGMILFLLMWLAPARVYYRLLFRNDNRLLDPLTRVYVLAAATNWVMLTVIMTVMPPHWAEAAWFGISLAIASILSKSCIGQPDVAHRFEHK